MRTFSKFLTYTFLAVGGYLVLTNSTGFGTDLRATDQLYTGAVSTLQGRNTNLGAPVA